MNIWSRMFVVILLAGSVSGCLTIKESYTFKRNGSGRMSYSLEFDPLDEAFTGTRDDMFPDSWSFESMAEAISRVPGISRIELSEAENGRGFGLSFKFKSLTSLNHALSRMLLTDTTEVFSYFKRENDLWVRRHKADKIQLSEAFVAKSRNESQVAALLNQLSYEVEMGFKQPIAVAYSESEGRILGRKNRIFRTEVSLADLGQSPEALHSTILLD